MPYTFIVFYSISSILKSHTFTNSHIHYQIYFKIWRILNFSKFQSSTLLEDLIFAHLLLISDIPVRESEWNFVLRCSYQMFISLSDFTFMYMHARIDVGRKETLNSNVRKLNNIDLRRVRVQMEHVLYKQSGHAIPVV